jgi:hypothetical protein
MAVPASTLLLIICYWHARNSGFNQASCIVRHRCHHRIKTSAVGPPAVWRAFQKVKHALYSRRALPLLQTTPLLNAPAASFIHAEKHRQIRAPLSGPGHKSPAPRAFHYTNPVAGSNEPIANHYSCVETLNDYTAIASLN